LVHTVYPEITAVHDAGPYSLWVCTKVSEEPTASVFNMEERDLKKMYSILFVI